MAPEIIVAAEEQQASASQQKSVSKGVEGEAKATRDAQKKDEQTPPAAANSIPTRAETFVFGIPQEGLTRMERQVPLDEPPPLAQNSELMYIGKPTVRYDGPAKVMGRGQ